MKREVAITAAGLALLAGTPLVAACASSTSTVYVNSSKVKASETRWVQQGNSDTWVLWYLLLLNNGQTMRVTQNYWNSAVPGQSAVYYNSTASGAVADPEAAEDAEEEQEADDISVEDQADEEDQSYDEESEEESGISDDDEEDFSEDDDVSDGDEAAIGIIHDGKLHMVTHWDGWSAL